MKLSDLACDRPEVAVVLNRGPVGGGLIVFKGRVPRGGTLNSGDHTFTFQAGEHPVTIDANGKVTNHPDCVLYITADSIISEE